MDTRCKRKGSGSGPPAKSANAPHFSPSPTLSTTAPFVRLWLVGMMEGQIKAKVTSRVNYPGSRPGSPTKNYGTSLSPPPMLRPKAKINSSATPQPRRPSGASSPSIRATVSSSATMTVPRAPSPFKPPSSQSRKDAASSASASAQIKAKLTSSARPRTAGGSSSPESRQRALTSATSEPHNPPLSRPRRGSASSTLTAPVAPPLHRGHASSPSSSKINVSPTSNENGSPSSASMSAVGARSLVRVKSKVSSLAEARPHSPSSLPPSPLLPSRPLAGHINRTARVPSISSIKVTPLLAPSPVANSSPGSGTTSPTSPTGSVAGPRFATTRETHSSKHHVFQPFHANDDNAVSYAAYNGQSHKTSVVVVDPASIPLPPQSPPTSTLSFSSRSSASRSSVSYETQNSSEASRSTAPTLNSRVNGTNGSVAGPSREERLSPPSSRMEGLGIKIMQAMADESFEDDYAADRISRRASSTNEEGGDADLLDRKKRAQAKSNRKIEDLEITNRSLLAINSSLEATKHRQAKEIRDLRRKLRESRLILPPQAYRAVKSSDPATLDDEDDDDEESEEEEQAAIEGKTDEAYRRVRGLLETLLEEGRRALEATPEGLAPGGKSGAKVLSEEEARTWRGDDLRISEDGGERRGGERPLTPSRVAIPDNDDGLEFADSEDEIEASLLDIDDIPPAAPHPNIKVTLSPS